MQFFCEAARQAKEREQLELAKAEVTFSVRKVWRATEHKVAAHGATVAATAAAIYGAGVLAGAKVAPLVAKAEMSLSLTTDIMPGTDAWKESATGVNNCLHVHAAENDFLYLFPLENGLFCKAVRVLSSRDWLSAD